MVALIHQVSIQAFSQGGHSCSAPGTDAVNASGFSVRYIFGAQLVARHISCVRCLQGVRKVATVAPQQEAAAAAAGDAFAAELSEREVLSSAPLRARDLGFLIVRGQCKIYVSRLPAGICSCGVSARVRCFCIALFSCPKARRLNGIRPSKTLRLCSVSGSWGRVCYIPSM